MEKVYTAEEIEEMYLNATIDALCKPVERTEFDVKREEANAANNAYYAANKGKILSNRKKTKTEKKKKLCKDRKVPDYLAEFISFREDGKVVLTFQDISEFGKTIHWLKFKSQYGEEILKIGDKPIEVITLPTK